jgi:hypothetical protein
MDRIAVGREDRAVGEMKMPSRPDQRVVVSGKEGDADAQSFRAASQALDASGRVVAMIGEVQFRHVAVEHEFVRLGDHRLERARQVDASAAEVEIRDDEGATAHDRFDVTFNVVRGALGRRDRR